MPFSQTPHSPPPHVSCFGNWIQSYVFRAFLIAAADDGWSTRQARFPWVCLNNPLRKCPRSSFSTSRRARVLICARVYIRAKQLYMKARIEILLFLSRALLLQSFIQQHGATLECVSARMQLAPFFSSHDIWRKTRATLHLSASLSPGLYALGLRTDPIQWRSPRTDLFQNEK